MTHIFISYAHANQSYARKLADFLLASGFDVWIDDRIDFGTNWVREIFKAIDASAALIVIMTPEAEASDWVQKEYLHADARKKPMFPLLLDGEVFPYFRSVQYYDVQGEKMPPPGFIRFLATFTAPSSSAGQDVAAAPQQMARQQAPPKRRRSWWAGGAVGLIALAAVIVLVVVTTQNNGAVTTPTATQGVTDTPLQAINAPTDTETTAPTFDPLTQVWIDFTRTAQAWTDTPSAIHGDEHRYRDPRQRRHLRPGAAQRGGHADGLSPDSDTHPQRRRPGADRVLQQPGRQLGNLRHERRRFQPAQSQQQFGGRRKPRLVAGWVADRLRHPTGTATTKSTS